MATIVDTAMLFVIGYVVALVTSGTTARRQRLGDLFAGTVVVRRSARAANVPVAQPA